MKILTLSVGQMATNCYLLIDESTRETAIIDPGEDADFISSTIQENRLLPKMILLTHGHYDHCLGVLELKLNYGLPIYLHSLDKSLYERATSSAKHFSQINIPKLPPIDHFFKDQEIITLGKNNLKVIHTPGHTPGSVCFHTETNLFTGDTLFSDSVGDTSHQYSSKTNLYKSLKTLSKLPNTTEIYPGHGESCFLSDTLSLTTSTSGRSSVFSPLLEE